MDALCIDSQSFRFVFWDDIDQSDVKFIRWRWFMPIVLSCTYSTVYRHVKTFQAL